MDISNQQLKYIHTFRSGHIRVEGWKKGMKISWLNWNCNEYLTVHAYMESWHASKCDMCRWWIPTSTSSKQQAAKVYWLLNNTIRLNVSNKGPTSRISARLIFLVLCSELWIWITYHLNSEWILCPLIVSTLLVITYWAADMSILASYTSSMHIGTLIDMR
jgi:hypothetical protein